ncbi:MAG: lipocalin family protein [Clostridia bacterium]|nr:lipocalin family protein [Clostridia bacterium]
MKKKIIALAAMISLILGLAACGNSDSSSLAGEWKLASIIQEGEITMYASDLSAFGVEMVLNLKEDGSGTMTITGQDDQELTWKASGNKVTLTADGDAIDFTYKDNLLIGEMDGASMSFAKSNSKEYKDALAQPSSLGNLTEDSSGQ